VARFSQRYLARPPVPQTIPDRHSNDLFVGVQADEL